MKKENRKIKKPWPTKDAMTQVYEMKLWGDDNSDFYSGEGSHRPDLVNPYIDALILFLNSFKEPITISDLGCGDFNIGKKLFEHTEKYIGVDIVEDLIQRNKEHYQAENLKFYSLDIAVDDLPSGDCALLRQVLQHLSNAEVLQISYKLKAYKYVIVTEHLPEGNFSPNEDIISGQGIRLKKHSGINLLEAPFNLKVIEEKQLSSVSLKDSQGVIVTTLYKLF